MLRSTGFFRGLDCPFYGENKGKAGEEECCRPYCHFRHGKQRRAASGIYDIKKTKQLPVDSADQGYDPFSPGVGGSGGNYSCEAPSDLSAGQNVELELVNQAIEAVRSEMEREKKKLSQMGDAEYEPTTASVKSRRLAAASSHQAYDPGSYQMGQASEYNPSPRSSKYTLDSESSGNSANAMEYVPTAVSKTSIKKVLSPPTSSIKNKYTLDNSKPPTDMEYDPLSNYSAKPTVKQQRTARPMGERNKRLYPTEREKHGADEEYVPTMKKPRSSSLTAAVPKYIVSFSESDGESSGTEYRPMSLSRMQRKAGVISLKPESTHANPSAQLKKQPIEESEECFSPGESDDADPQGAERPGKTTAEKKAQCQSKLSKSAPSKKHEKESTKTIKEKPSKSSSKDAPKVKIQSKRVDGNSKSKEKTPIKSHKEGTESKNIDKSKKLKVKGEIGLKDKDKPSGETKNHRNEKSVKSNKVSTAFKNHKNGKVEIRSQEKDKTKRSQAVGSGNKEKSKKTCTVLELKEKHQSLSHADLFGAESAEEEDERIVRKCASALKRGRLGNKKIINSEVTSSSSEGEDCFEAMDYSCLQEELENDSDMMEECLRIFNESKEVKTEDKGRQAKQLSKEQDDEEEEDTECTLTLSGQKKRVSHYKAQGKSETSLNAAPMPQRRLTPQEICYRRMQKAQEQAAQLTAAVKTASASPSQTLGLPGEKRRVAHRPNATLSSSKPRPAGASNRVLSPTNLPVKVQTSAAIQSKTSSTSVQKRVAHTPTLKSSTMKRPIIPTEFGAKVPTNVRQRYLNIFIDECLKFCSSEKQAFQMALDEEKVVYDRSSSKNIYLNVAVNTLKKLRGKNTPVSPSVESSAASVNRRAQSHEEMLGGRLAAKTSFTINRSGKQQDVNLKGASLYKKLKAYMMTDEQLQEHGYPRPHPVNSGHAVVHNLPEKKNNDPFSKICCRCGAEYKINVNGSCVRKEECNHHWGKLRRNRVPGGWETLYNCCSGAVGSPGCEVAKQHVQDGRKESLAGFMKTFSKPLTVDGNGGVYALDCEMCYTKIGLELTRVTVINADLKVVYDTFVKPGSRVVDYNTRFSGVTQEDLENTTITLRDVQAVLLNMFSAESILLGHSLESDLFSLKLIHSTVVDTAIVFPHRLGLPYKRALRNLMADHLKRIIQDSVGGHDSSEDARACMELMVWKIKEDAKVKR